MQLPLQPNRLEMKRETRAACISAATIIPNPYQRAPDNATSDSTDSVSSTGNSLTSVRITRVTVNYR